MKTGEEKKKPRYSVLQNTGYLLGKWWEDDKKNLLLAFSRVPALVLISFIGVILPRTVIDCLERRVEPWYLVTLVGILTLALCLFHGWERYVGGKMFGIGLKNRVRLLREQLWRCMDTDYENMESSEGQKLRQRASNFTNGNSSGGEAIIHAITTLVTDTCGLILYGVILSTLHPLAIFLLLALSLLAFGATRAVENYEYRNRDQWVGYEQRLWYLYFTPSDFAAGKDVRLYRIANWFSKLFFKSLENLIIWKNKIQFRWFGVGGLQGVLNFVRDAIAYAYLIIRVLDGKITVADFTMFFGAVTGFSVWMNEMILQIGELIRISLECNDYRDFIEMPDHLRKSGGRPTEIKADTPCEIDFEHVTFCYPGSKDAALQDVSFHINAGEKIALVGINGAGKTTCVKLLCSLYRPTSGMIRINGIDVSEFNRDDYFTFFSAVFQEANYLPYSIAQNVAACREPEIDYKRVDQCLEMAGILERVKRLPDGVHSLMNKEVNLDAVNFSGGEFQKLLLARALYKEAPIIVLDEPTAALDPISENELYQKYGELTKNRTSIFISHRLSSTRFCDRILFLENGKIAEEGTHSELMALGGSYAKMFEIQSHYYKRQLEMERGESL